VSWPGVIDLEFPSKMRMKLLIETGSNNEILRSQKSKDFRVERDYREI
jgi:hypothetical protein